MKILNQPLATRHHNLKLELSCSHCGAVIEAEGEEDIKKYRKGTPKSYCGNYIGAVCPCCGEIIKAPPLEDKQLTDYLWDLEPTYITDSPSK